MKIEIKSILDKLLFEFEKEDNSIKETVQEARRRGADLVGANLQGADLVGAYLQGADLRDADLRDVKIKKAAVLTGLYKYIVIPFISEGDVNYVKMGCYTRTVAEWDADFWNNPNEFPNNGDKDSKLRLFAYETAKRWFEIEKE